MLVYELIDPDTHIIKYVGITKNTAQHRFQMHLKDAKTKERKHEYLSKKEKWLLELDRRHLTPIIYTVDSNLSENEAIELEATLIAKYKRYFEGGLLLNVQEGGFYDSCKATVWNKGISHCYSEKTIQANKEHQPGKKEVYRFDLKGNFIDKWNSIREMCEKLHFDRRAVMRCLKGENNFISHKKYMFSHNNIAPIYHNKSTDKTYHNSPHSKAIKAIKDKENIEFRSIKEASETLKIPAALISSVLIKKQKTTHGYKFEYLK